MVSQQPGFPERTRCRSAAKPAAIPVGTGFTLAEVVLVLFPESSGSLEQPAKGELALPEHGALPELAAP